ncbi:DUF6346 domain-containing protein [Actinoplanes derwentensis]|nr:DUF6346 domain-containing protein [Actinoplanes derwentensis]GID87811.1 hypothetical protein Ade03nite_67350 [Actinoplanes derwentensis]
MTRNLESSVVADQRADGRPSVRGLLVLIVVGWLLFNAGTTIGRFTGPDYSETTDRGVGTVEKCERRGPITLFDGVGYFDACYLWVEWDRNASERILVDDPGFFQGEKPGDTVRIGYGVSRPEVSHWSTLDLLMYCFCGIGALLAGLGLLRLGTRLKQSLLA